MYQQKHGDNLDSMRRETMVRLCMIGSLIAVLVAGLACSTPGSSSESGMGEKVASAGSSPDSGEEFARNVCEASLAAFRDQGVQYVGRNRSIPETCRWVEVHENNGGYVATVYYHGDPVPWRFEVERGMGEAEDDATLPGLSRALKSSPEKIKQQRAADSIVMLKSYIVTYYKTSGGGNFPSSLDDLTELEDVSAIPDDPWGNRYLYNTSGNQFVLLSPGPDGRTDTSDDVTAESDCVGGARDCIEVLHVY